MEPRNARLDPDGVLANLDWVRGLARRLVSDPGAADDVLQETWLAARRHRPPSGSPLRAWLGRVARNTALQMRRHESIRRGHEQASAVEDTLPSAGELVERASVQRAVVDAVLALDEPYRRTVFLRYFEGLTPSAIAKRTGTPVATVKTRLRRALALLRERLDRAHGGDGRSWVLALLPLVPRPRWSAPPFLEALLVSTSLKITLPAAALAVVAVVWIRGHEGDVPAPREPARAASPPAALVAPELPAQGPAEIAPAARTEVAPPVVAEEASAKEELLRARVLDLAGRPVGGVEIGLRKVSGDSLDEDGRMAIWEEDAPAGEPVAISGPDGWLSLPPDREPFGALVSQDERWETVLAPTPWPGEECVLLVAPRFALRGHVRDSSGAPFAGARLAFVLPEAATHDLDVALSGYASGWRAATDADGAFSLPRLPAVAGAALRVRAEGFPRLEVERDAWADDVLELVLEDPERGWLEGVVRGPSGAPIADACVGLGSRGVRTGVDGRFRLGLEGIAEATTLRAAAAGYLPATLEGQAPEEGGPVRWPALVELRLAGEPLALAGRVTDGEGAGLAGIEVMLADPDALCADGLTPVLVESLLAGESAWTVETKTGDDGGFRLEGLQPRDYRLRVVDPEAGLVLERGPFAAGSEDVAVVIPADACWAEVRGMVVTSAGEGIAGATLSVTSQKDVVRAPGSDQAFLVQAHGARTETAEDGSFALRRVPRTGATLRCTASGFNSLDVSLTPDTDPEDLRIVLGAEVSLRVRLRDPAEADGFALLDRNGARVSMRYEWGGMSWDTTYCGHLSDGRSSVITAGDDAVLLVLYHGNEAGREIPVTLLSGEINELEL